MSTKRGVIYNEWCLGGNRLLIFTPQHANHRFKPMAFCYAASHTNAAFVVRKGAPNPLTGTRTLTERWRASEAILQQNAATNAEEWASFSELRNFIYDIDGTLLVRSGQPWEIVSAWARDQVRAWYAGQPSAIDRFTS